MLLYRHEYENVRYQIRINGLMKSGLSWPKCITNSDFVALYFGKHHIDVGQEFTGYDDSGFDFMRYGRNVISHMYQVWITISLM